MPKNNNNKNIGRLGGGENHCATEARKMGIRVFKKWLSGTEPAWRSRVLTVLTEDLSLSPSTICNISSREI